MVASTTAPSAAPMTFPEPPVTLTPPMTAAASEVSSQPEARITVTVPTRAAYRKPARPHMTPPTT